MKRLLRLCSRVRGLSRVPGRLRGHDRLWRDLDRGDHLRLLRRWRWGLLILLNQRLNRLDQVWVEVTDLSTLQVLW